MATPKQQSGLTPDAGDRGNAQNDASRELADSDLQKINGGTEPVPTPVVGGRDAASGLASGKRQ